MKAKIVLPKFGKVIAPLELIGNKEISSNIVFTGKDIESLLEELECQFQSGFFSHPKRTQRQKDIAEYCQKLRRLISKEKHIEGCLWSPFISA